MFLEGFEIGETMYVSELAERLERHTNPDHFEPASGGEADRQSQLGRNFLVISTQNNESIELPHLFHSRAVPMCLRRERGG